METYKRDDIPQKRPIFLRSLLIVASHNDWSLIVGMLKNKGHTQQVEENVPYSVCRRMRDMFSILKNMGHIQYVEE